MFNSLPVSITSYRSAVLALTACALLLAGCGATTDTTKSNDELPLAVKGTVFGGQQPISGATVTLYAVGTTGYGSPATNRGSVQTDGTGSFSFGAGENTCVSGDEIYIVATGGDSGSGTDNPAVTLMSLLGSCTASKTAVVNIDEVSTVASVFSLAQYFNPSTGSFGSTSANTIGVTNAIATAGILADLSHGVANTSITVGSTIVNTLTPESSKLNLIADILAACVNSNESDSTTSDACSTLFNNAVPPPNGAVTALGSSATFPIAQDTLTAAYYLAVNPTNASTLGTPGASHISNLMGIASANAPFQPALATQPTDWTLGISYTSNTSTGSSPNVFYPMSATYNPQVNATGSIFYLNLPSGGNQSRATMGASGEWTSSGPAASSSDSPMSTGTTLDSLGDVYYGPRLTNATYGTGNGIYETPNTHNFSPAYSGSYETYAAFAADGTQNTLSSSYFAQILATDAVNGRLYLLPASTSTVTHSSLTLLASSLSLTGATGYGLALDQQGNAWVAETGANAISEVLSYSGSPTTTRVASSTAFRNPAAVAIDSSNNVWVANASGGSDNGFLTYVIASGPTPVADTVSNDGGVNNPVEVAVDGAGNAWVANAGQSASYTGQTVSELAYVGGAIVPLSPSGASGGYAHNYNGVSGIAIDGSGNVWVTNSGAVAGTSTTGLITEIVGAAVPIVTPLALGIRNGTLATKP